MQQTFEVIVCRECKFKEKLNSKEPERVWGCTKMTQATNTSILVTIPLAGAPTKCELFEERKKWPSTLDRVKIVVGKQELHGDVTQISLENMIMELKCRGFVATIFLDSTVTWSPA